MRSKSTAAVIRQMKASNKKVSYHNAINAIEKKLVEIKRSSNESTGREASMPLFRHLA